MRSVDLLFFFLPRGSNLSFERKELNSVRRAAASDTCFGDLKKLYIRFLPLSSSLRCQKKAPNETLPLRVSMV